MTNQQFISENKTKSIPEIALQLSKHPQLDKDFILAQINGLQKAKTKLSEFYQKSNIVYPKSISIEQCSSETTAVFKSRLLKGKTLIDLTGGFGIDSYYFSKEINQVTHLEPNKELHEIVKQNFNALSATNINCIQSTAEDFLQSNLNNFNLAYIDPSRRNENQKVFRLEDCIPNIIELQHETFKYAPKILVKTSPILDIKQSIASLKTVAKIWVVSVNNECKEVLYLLANESSNHIDITAVNLNSNQPEFTFNYNDEQNSIINLSKPLSYLYEPNASILKAGAFKCIGKAFNAFKLEVSSHLYTSENLLATFPGRSFKIENVIPYQPKQFKKLGIKKANLSCRNFKDSVVMVKKKLNINDGGDCYIFATTDMDKKPILIVCTKAN